MLNDWSCGIGFQSCRGGSDRIGILSHRRALAVWVWLLLLPFRLLGIAVGGALALVSALILLPVHVLRRV